MGLTLTAVNKNYGYTKDGEERKRNKDYFSTDTGYGAYKFFREDFMSFLTNGSISTFDELFTRFFPNGYWYNEKYVVLVNLNDFEEANRSNPKVLDYLDRLDLIKDKYPKLYDCFAFVTHNDCEGEMPYEQLVLLVPHLKEYHEQTGKTWGYSGWGYDWVQDLIECCEETIKHKGKIWFS